MRPSVDTPRWPAQYLNSNRLRPTRSTLHCGSVAFHQPAHSSDQTDPLTAKQSTLAGLCSKRTNPRSTSIYSCFDRGSAWPSAELALNCEFGRERASRPHLTGTFGSANSATNSHSHCLCFWCGERISRPTSSFRLKSLRLGLSTDHPSCSHSNCFSPKVCSTI